MRARRRWLLAVAWLAIVVGLPLLGHALRRPSQGHCALDGEVIDPIYAVRVLSAGDSAHDFCCLRCAERWLESTSPPEAILVTDEISGRLLPAEDAIFVRSAVVTQPATGNRIHVFARRIDAAGHARSAGGRILSSGEWPPRTNDAPSRTDYDGS